MIWAVDGGAPTTPGSGSSGFTVNAVLVADSTGAINDGPSNTYLYTAPLNDDILVSYNFASHTGGAGWQVVHRPTVPTTLGQAGIDFAFYGSAGAAGSGATAGGAGGGCFGGGGAGGAGTATGVAGVGGDIYFTAGFAGADNGGGGARGGDWYGDAGTGTGAGRHGDALLGTAYPVRYIRLGTATVGQIVVGNTAPTGAEKFHVSGTIAPAVNANGYVSQFGGTITEASSGTHAVLAGAAFLAPTITAGAGATTTAATVYVAGAPTGATYNHGVFSAAPIALSNDVGVYCANASGVPFRALYMTTGNRLILGFDGTTVLNSVDIYGGGAGLVRFPDANVFCAADLEIDGALNHDGTTVGFYQSVPAVQAGNTAAATDLASVITLANALRTMSKNVGLMNPA